MFSVTHSKVDRAGESPQTQSSNDPHHRQDICRLLVQQPVQQEIPFWGHKAFNKDASALIQPSIQDKMSHRGSLGAALRELSQMTIVSLHLQRWQILVINISSCHLRIQVH